MSLLIATGGIILLLKLKWLNKQIERFSEFSKAKSIRTDTENSRVLELIKNYAIGVSMLLMLIVEAVFKMYLLQDGA